MANFLLLDADDDLWHQFKERAQSEGRSLRWIVITLIEHYIKHGLPAAPKTKH